jgi:hypothetical protein
MNVWFDCIGSSLEIERVKPGVALHIVVGRRSRYSVVKGMDYPQKFNGRRIKQARDAALKLMGMESEETFPSILVIDRASSDDFHTSRESETEMSGARRRSVPNLYAACKTLLAGRDWWIVDMASTDPRSQIARAQAARVLIGQHGAGMTHMIWMPEGSVVIEIQPPLPDEAVDIFENLARALRHRYIRVPQESTHAEVEIAALEGALRQA